MGKERDKLIRSLEGVPLSDEDLSDDELVRRSQEYYSEQGRLPPEIEALRRGMEKAWESQTLVVGYGTLLSRASLASTVGAAGETKTFIPVTVDGFRRTFNLRPGHYEPSYHLTHEPVELAAMNVQPMDDFRFNGVAFPVSTKDLEVLDDREKYYQRIEVQIQPFPDIQAFSGTGAGRDAFVFSAGPDSPWVIDDPELLRPHWRDLVLAREGAYALGRHFGEMFDSTTYLAGGRMLVVDEYSSHLPSVEDS